MSNSNAWSNEQLQIALDSLVETSKSLVEELESLRAAANLVIRVWESGDPLDDALQELRAALKPKKGGH